MKIKNIVAGDFVQVKKSMCHSEFKAKQVCEVIDIDPTDKYGFDVLIKGKNCLDWVNHKHLKKPEPQLKQLDQDDDIARELLEVDLISELTGSDLCRKMLERGDRCVMCVVGTHKEVVVINGIDGEGFTSRGSYLNYHTPIPINNQGEPLTASEVGL